jgi:iron complex transport system permease protein
MKGRHRIVLALLCASLITEIAASLSFGRFSIPPRQVVEILLAHLHGTAFSASPNADTVLMLVRLPRVCAALLVGMSLSLAGSCYQTVFRNPLASPSLLGVSSGAGFGAASALLSHWPWWGVQSAAFSGGVLTVAIAMACNNLLRGRSMVTLVLCGLVVAAFFEAMISVVKYFADPMDVLPSITFWQMGSLEKVAASDLVWAAPILCACALLLYLLRWKYAALALSDQEATSLGISTLHLRSSVIGIATLMVAVAVSLTGTIGWVGLIVPHAARMLFGLSPNRIFPATVLIGAMCLLAIDDIARSAISTELPLSVLTAMIGAPLFLFLLTRIRTTTWS